MILELRYFNAFDLKIKTLKIDSDNLKYIYNNGSEIKFYRKRGRNSPWIFFNSYYQEEFADETYNEEYRQRCIREGISQLYLVNDKDFNVILYHCINYIGDNKYGDVILSPKKEYYFQEPFDKKYLKDRIKINERISSI